MKLKRLLFSLLGAYLIVWLAAITYLSLKQREILYHPTAEGTRSPAQFSLPFDEIDIASADGVSLHGWWVPAVPLPGHKPITLVYFHGNGGNLADRAHVIPLFHSQHWNVLMATYRGYGKSSASGADGVGITEAGIYRDAQAMYDWASQKLPDDVLILWGHSLGAAISAWVAAHNKEAAALILESPFSSVLDMARFRYPWLYIPPLLVTERYPTIDYVRMRQMPLLVMSAQSDSTIPPLMGERVFAAANEPKSFHALTGVEHNNFPDFFAAHSAFLADWVTAAITNKNS